MNITPQNTNFEFDFYIIVVTLLLVRQEFSVSTYFKLVKQITNSLAAEVKVHQHHQQLNPMSPSILSQFYPFPINTVLLQ